MKIRALIVDDEPLARRLINKYCEDSGMVEVVGQAVNGLDALQKISDLEPELIFLDIQMPGVTGLGMLEMIDEPPLIIFVTAYDEYAVKAFEKNAIDYLLKPVEYERFVAAIHRAHERQSSKELTKEYSLMIENLRKGTSPWIDNIPVKVKGDIVILKVDEISYFEALDDYVVIRVGTKKLLKKQTLKILRRNLTPTNLSEFTGRILSMLNHSIK
ncbi:MAG: response regulator [Ignavibacteriales bacterium]|nr:response regulator [Ignavibacteriales bacterium]